MKSVAKFRQKSFMLRNDGSDRKRMKNVRIYYNYIYTKVGNVHISFPPTSSNAVVLPKLIVFINATHILIVLSYKFGALNELSLIIFLLSFYIVYFICLTICRNSHENLVSCQRAMTKFSLCRSFYSPLCLSPFFDVI